MNKWESYELLVGFDGGFGEAKMEFLGLEDEKWWFWWFCPIKGTDPMAGAMRVMAGAMCAKSGWARF